MLLNLTRLLSLLLLSLSFLFLFSSQTFACRFSNDRSSSQIGPKYCNPDEYQAFITYRYDDGTSCTRLEYFKDVNLQTPAEACPGNCTSHSECGFPGICANPGTLGSNANSLICSGQRYAEPDNGPRACMLYTCGFHCAANNSCNTQYGLPNVNIWNESGIYRDYGTCAVACPPPPPPPSQAGSPYGLNATCEPPGRTMNFSWANGQNSTRNRIRADKDPNSLTFIQDWRGLTGQNSGYSNDLVYDWLFTDRNGSFTDNEGAITSNYTPNSLTWNNAEPGKTYKWWMDGVNSAGTPSSENSTSSVTCKTCPPKVQALGPNATQNCQINLQQQIVLNWPHSPNASGYDIRVDDGDGSVRTAWISNGTQNNCGPHDICFNSWSASNCANGSCYLTINVHAARSYQAWIHAYHPGCGATAPTYANFSIPYCMNSVSCYGNNAQAGQSTQWQANVFVSRYPDATNRPTYEWSGSDNFYSAISSSEVARMTYSSPGNKTATVTARLGNQISTATCNINVSPPISPRITSCTPNKTSAATGESLTYTMSVNPGGYAGNISYSWEQISGSPTFSQTSANNQSSITGGFTSAGTGRIRAAVYYSNQVVKYDCNPVSVTNPPPPSALSISASPYCKAFYPNIDINWSSPAGALRYYVARQQTNNPSTFTWLVYGNNTNNYNDNGVVAGQSYQYYVVAQNNWGFSPPTWTSPVTARIDCTPPPPSTPVINITATCNSFNPRNNVSWSSTGATNYYVARQQTGNSNTFTWLVYGGSNTFYPDDGVAAGQSYQYYVVAKNSWGFSPSTWSSPVIARADCIPNLSITSCNAAPNPANIGQTVTWNADVTGGTGWYYYQWRGDNNLNFNSNWTTTTNTQVTTSYPSEGVKNAAITVYSPNTPNSPRSASCQVTVSPRVLNNVICSVTPSSPNPGDSVRFRTDLDNTSGGIPGSYTYFWEGLPNPQPTPNPTTGNEIARTIGVGSYDVFVTVASGSQSQRVRCGSGTISVKNPAFIQTDQGDVHSNTEIKAR